MNTAYIASADITSLEAEVRKMLRLTLVTGEMERAEGTLIIVALYMGNADFSRGLHDLAWRHQETLKLILEKAQAPGPAQLKPRPARRIFPQRSRLRPFVGIPRPLVLECILRSASQDP